MGDEYCKKCGECCRNIVIEKSTQKLYYDGIQDVNEDFLSMLIFKGADEKYDYFTCKYLKNSLCTNPQKPDICSKFPTNPFAFLPDGCGYYGIVFQKKEAVKQKIRRLKEEIIHYNTMIETEKDKSQKQQYSKIIESHKRYISKYAVYNSDDW